MVVTVYAYGRLQVLRASTRTRLARLLYLTCPWWTHGACELLVGYVVKGQVVTAPDFEALLLPGDFGVLEVRPAEDPDWQPGVAA